MINFWFKDYLLKFKRLYRDRVFERNIFPEFFAIAKTTDAERNTKKANARWKVLNVNL